jgi:hypothetical protein
MNLIRHLEGDGLTALFKQDDGIVISGIAEVDTTPVKLAIENIGDRALGATPFGGEFLTIEQLGTSDGWTFTYHALDPNGTLSHPWGVSTAAPAAVLSAGGAFVAGTYGVVVTARNAQGETTASVEVVFVAVLNQKATYTWARVPGAVDYVVYRTDTDDPGNYGAYSLVDEVVDPGTGTTASLIDVGDPPAAGTPPLVNTSGSTVYEDLGDPPADVDFTQDPLTVASAPSGFAIGQQFFYWHRLIVPPGTSSFGNKRAARILPKEI